MQSTAIRQVGAPLGFGNALFTGNLSDIPFAQERTERGPLVQYQCRVQQGGGTTTGQ